MKLSRRLARLAIVPTIAAGSALALPDHVSAGEVASVAAPARALVVENPDLPPGCMWTWNMYMIVVYGAAGWCYDNGQVVWFDWNGNYWSF